MIQAICLLFRDLREGHRDGNPMIMCMAAQNKNIAVKNEAMRFFEDNICLEYIFVYICNPIL